MGGGFRSRDERKRAEKMWNMNEEKMTGELSPTEW
jgi:hypothetical protein